MMLQRFKQELETRNWQHKKIIAAVSGGGDSMSMVDLLFNSGVEMVIAHVNYQLRGRESDEDENLVNSWASENGVPFYLLKVDLNAILIEKGGNLQVSARDYRYDFFRKLKKELNFDLIATAHHQSDSVESMLINFFKGTGIAGMHGILPEQGDIIRPLLHFKKQEIEEHNKKYSVPWRTDKSNFKNDYVRNKLRNQVIPLLEKVFPQVQNNLVQNISRFQEVEIIYDDSIEKIKKDLLEKRKEDWFIPVLKLKRYQARQTILYEILKEFGFQSNQIPVAVQLLGSGSGKMIQSKTHRLIRDRAFLIITSMPAEQSTFIFIDRFENSKEISFSEGKLKFQWFENQSSNADLISKSKNLEKEEVFVSFGEISFPIILRPWKQGDYFYPLGMKKKKKISRFLIDQKVSLPEKEKTWVLESEKKVFWVVGMRLDERFKLKESTRKVLRIAWEKA